MATSGAGGWVGLTELLLLLLLLQVAVLLLSGLSDCSQTSSLSVLLVTSQIRLQALTFRSYFVIRSVLGIECFNRFITPNIFLNHMVHSFRKIHFSKRDGFIHSAKLHFPKPYGSFTPKNTFF